jgi:hypothetical protein
VNPIRRKNLMSDRDEETPAAIELRNIRTARLIREYWKARSVELAIADDPGKGPRFDLGPNGLPRGYKGEEALPLKTRR